MKHPPGILIHLTIFNEFLFDLQCIYVYIIDYFTFYKFVEFVENRNEIEGEYLFENILQTNLCFINLYVVSVRPSICLCVWMYDKMVK